MFLSTQRSASVEEDGSRFWMSCDKNVGRRLVGKATRLIF